jgi:simple sugar transport system permease protein
VTATIEPVIDPDLEEPAGVLPRLSASMPRTVVRAILTFALTITAALVAAIPLIYLAGSDPITTYHALIEGSLGSQQAIAETLIATTPLLLAGLAVAIGFQAGLFNIGVEGQLVMGGLVAGTIGSDVSLPGGLHLLVALLGGAAAGGLWGLVPGLLKAYRGVHEVITTIMMNYIAFSLSQYLVRPGGLLVSATQPSATDVVHSNAELPQIWEPTRLHAGILVAAVATVAAWYFLYRSPTGYTFRVVGVNATAARFNGIRPRRITVNGLVLSGGLGGLAGAVEVLGLHHRYFDSFSPGYGFDAIAVALLGMLNPIGVAVSAFFFGMLRAGSVLLQARAGISRDMITAISGLVIAFVAARPAVDWLLERRAKTRLVRERREPRR